MYIAHIDHEGKYQTCKAHSFGAAEVAKKDLSGVGLENTAYLAAILHDAGKFSDKFNNYIKNAYAGKSVRKGEVIHSFSGCSYILNKFHSNDLGIKAVTAELIAYAIAAHHGLFDCIDEDGKSQFEHRKKKQPDYDYSSIKNFFNECVSEEKILCLFDKANGEIEKKISEIQRMVTTDATIQYKNEVMFYIGLLERLILSAVIDGDRTDTFCFMSRADRAIDNYFSWDKYIDNVEKYIAGFKKITSVQNARGELSEICKSFSAHEPGIYRLNIPTGSGKTLSGLRFAIHHAYKWNKNRIIYVAPLISILEQNVRIIKEAVGDLSIVLEHHSNIVVDDEDTEECITNNFQLLTETWDSPIVVTTLVQFLNTLFGGKTSQIRRFTALSDSVIIIDEVQSVPWKMVSLFNLAINFLNKICGATIILCSATLPDFDEGEYKMLVSKQNLLNASQTKYYNEIFKRSEIKDDGGYRLEQIPNYVKEKIISSKSILVICNKKMQSEFLYNKLKCEDYNLFHLSASMCVQHREKVLSDIYDSIESGIITVCISTQVIEAGVDISFETVIRFKAGLESIVQANGRCNRHGENNKSKTYIIDCLDENLNKLEEIKMSKNATTKLLYYLDKNGDSFNNDITSDKAVGAYYNIVKNNLKEDYRQYYIKKYNTTLLDFYSQNQKWLGRAKNTNYFLNQAFKTAGNVFEPLDSDTISIVVPYGDGIEIISELCSEKCKYDLNYSKKMIKKAKRFSVSIMKYQEKKLLEKGAIYTICDNTIYVLRDEFYDSAVGLRIGEEDKKECSILIL